jgi:glutamine synthetase
VFGSASEALKFITDHDIAMVDLKVGGINGQWLHITIPATSFSMEQFEGGVGYDGSSGSGFGKVESGDVAALPKPETAFLDPFWEHPTLSFICDTVQADTKELFPSDPRTIARRAVEYMRGEGIADEALMGPEFEFHVFDRVEVVNSPYMSLVDIDCDEVHTDGMGAGIPLKKGYLRMPPCEQLHDLRSEICMVLADVGVDVKYHHHEVGAPGQCEIEVNLGPLMTVADQTMLIKYVIKNVAHRYDKIATFMPKPVFGEAGNGMHVHQKLQKDGKPLFYDFEERNYACLSDLALQYTGGLLLHGRALTGLTNPSTNSFKRLVEGYEAPVNLFFSLANRSAAIRVPKYAVSPDAKRIEYRPPDFTSNIYLTLAAMLMAGIDGVKTGLNLEDHHFGPYDVDIARQDEAFRRHIVGLPRSLHDALDALAQDREFLERGGVFPPGFLDGWIGSKRTTEANAVAVRPHPFEFELYLDC